MTLRMVDVAGALDSVLWASCCIVCAAPQCPTHDESAPFAP